MAPVTVSEDQLPDKVCITDNQFSALEFEKVVHASDGVKETWSPAFAVAFNLHDPT